MAQTVKNPFAMWETWVRSLGWEDPLEEDMTTHSSFLAWRSPTDREAWWATVHAVVKSWTQLNACNVGDLGLIPRLGRSTGGGHDNPLQFSCLESPQEQRSLTGCSARGCNESDTTD